MGDGEVFTATLANNNPGGIREITILDAGLGLKSVPQLDLTAYGDGTAIVEAVLVPTVETLPGRWEKQDGILSSSYMKIQGREYYINYSYVLISELEFSNYKQILKEFLHPAGMIAYAEITRLNEITTIQVTAESEIAQANSA